MVVVVVEMVASELSHDYRQVGMLAASIVVVEWLIGDNVNGSRHLETILTIFVVENVIVKELNFKHRILH